MACPLLLNPSGGSMLAVKEIMTKKLITISAATPISEAAKLMEEKRIRHLPVVDDNDGIIGILTSKDLPEFPDAKNASVQFYMSTPVFYLNHEVPLKEAIYKILESKISCLLLCDEQNNAVGIVTTDDLLWYLVSKLEKENHSFVGKILDIPTLGQVAHQLSQYGI
jgi:acetoin utilization protein AcuB